MLWWRICPLNNNYNSNQTFCRQKYFYSHAWKLLIVPFLLFVWKKKKFTTKRNKSSFPMGPINPSDNPGLNVFLFRMSGSARSIFLSYIFCAFRQFGDISRLLPKRSKNKIKEQKGFSECQLWVNDTHVLRTCTYIFLCVFLVQIWAWDFYRTSTLSWAYVGYLSGQMHVKPVCSVQLIAQKSILRLIWDWGRLDVLYTFQKKKASSIFLSFFFSAELQQSPSKLIFAGISLKQSL